MGIMICTPYLDFMCYIKPMNECLLAVIDTV